eukprot:2160441-Rhodomonas_salina.2
MMLLLSVLSQLLVTFLCEVSRRPACFRTKSGVRVEPENIITTTGSSGAFVVGFLAAFDPGSDSCLPMSCPMLTQRSARHARSHGSPGLSLLPQHPASPRRGGGGAAGDGRQQLATDRRDAGASARPRQAAWPHHRFAIKPHR